MCRIIVKITPQNFYPRKIAPWENYPQWNPLPTYKSYKWKKKQNYKIFCLEESCATQYPYQNNQGPLSYTNDLTENTGLRYFLYRMKKIQKSTESKNRQVAFTCQLYKSRRTKTRQSNYKIWQNVKVLNSQLSMDSTLWILIKANSKMHALGRSVTIIYESGYVLAAHVSIMYTLQISLIKSR